jgi:hypothetical protein
VTFPCCCGFSTRKLRPLPLRGNLALEIAMILGGQDRQKRRLHYHQATDSGLRMCFDFFFLPGRALQEKQWHVGPNWKYKQKVKQ